MKAGPAAPWSVPEPLSWTRRPNSENSRMMTLSAWSCSRKSAMKASSPSDTALHGDLWSAVSEGLEAFMADLREHDHADNVIILLFSEFGRRVHDNGSGTDHGAAGPAFILGEKVKGGHYGEYPALKAEKLVQGDLNPSTDFRSIYSTILEKWLKLDSKPITGGRFEQL